MRNEQMDELLAIIERTGFATVKAIATETYQSPSTIRRRLDELEKAGLVKRSYGGAELRKNNSNTPIGLRLQKNHKAKDVIAGKAAALVADHSVLFIDASSSCLHMAPYLASKKGLTVYTYGIELCDALAQYDMKVYCLGGLYDHVSRAFSGEYALRMAQSVYYDAFFFSSSAYCEGTVYDYAEAETHLRRAILANSAKSYFLCDHEKFGKRSSYVLCRETELTGILTE